MSSPDDFQGLAKQLKKSGIEATAPASLTGKSGANHEFAFAAYMMSGDSLLVADTALSLKDVDETKVLSFYAKVYDVSPEHAVLCASPRLDPKGSELAREYEIQVVENEVPKELVPMVAKYIAGLSDKTTRKKR